MQLTPDEFVEKLDKHPARICNLCALMFPIPKANEGQKTCDICLRYMKEHKIKIKRAPKMELVEAEDRQ